MARYVIRAANEGGPVEFNDRLTIDAALQRVQELEDAHFRHITITNVLTGVEITDVEALIRGQDGAPNSDPERPGTRHAETECTSRKTPG
jgi:hypothetical protein